MPRFSSFFLNIIVLIFPLVSFAGSAVPDFIPLDEITPGMEGYGLTVFEGTRIDTFTVKVIGIQKNNRPAGSMLLIEVGGHGLEKSAIAQGMSGSPIYLGGRFAGALAFGWAGALRPIAGVTPAAEILALPVALPTADQTKPGRMSLNSLLQDQPDGNALARELSIQQKNGDTAGDWSVLGAGMTERWPSAEKLARVMLDQLGVFTGQGGSQAGGKGPLLVQPAGQGVASGLKGAAKENKETLHPGSACAIALVMGAAQMGVTGTVTWVHDDQVFMFGHPFMQRGPVALPLATAEVLTLFPSRQMSFKMASMGHPVGAVHHDQRAGVSGRLGDVPAMIPVGVELIMPAVSGSDPETVLYEFTVADDPLLSPTLVFWSLYNALLARADDASLQTLHYEITTTWDGPGVVSDEPLVLSGVTAGPGSVQALASQWMAPLSMLLNNSFHPVSLQSVQARLELSRPMETARIVGLSGPRVAPAAGGPIVFKAEIEPRQGERRFIDLSFRLPEGLEPGSYRVVATSAAELFSLEPLRAPGSFEVSSLDAVLDVLRAPRAHNTLVLAVLAPGKGVVLQGREMKSLPRRVTALLKQGNMMAQPTLADYVLRVDNTVPWALQGHAVRVMQLKDDPESLKIERRP